MENKHWFRYCKFFRGLVATSKPEEIPEIVEQYKKQQRQIESNYMDIVLNSDGTISYNQIMTMELPSIELLVERMNARIERMSGKSKQML